VDEFAAAIKARLDEQAAKDYTGWDGDCPANTIRSELLANALQVYKYGTDKIVDIGARAMMLYYRDNKHRGEG